MLVEYCKSKIHRAKVTKTDLDYEGSIGIDSGLLGLAGISPYEKVHVLDINNGNRLETYAVPEKAGSGTVAIYGAAAKLVAKGDLIIVISYGLSEKPVRPKIVLVDSKNRPKT